MPGCAVADIVMDRRCICIYFKIHFGNTLLSWLTYDHSYSLIWETIHYVFNGRHYGTAERTLVFNQK